MRLDIGSFIDTRVRVSGLVLGLAFIASLLCVSSASAVTPVQKNALGISPPLFELSANPSDTLKHTIRVDNLTDRKLPITVERKDFVALGEEGQAELTTKPSSYSLSTWIKPDVTSFELAPRSSRTVSFKIIVPSKAEPGGHFGSLVFKTTAPATTTNGVGVGQEIGGLILLRVSGKAKEVASIASFKSTKDIWEGAPIEFETRFKNGGNVQLKPSGTVTITNMFGQKIGSVSLESRTVLPDSIRKITSKWNGDGWPGWYTATASIGYGSKGQLLTNSTSFLVFPYKIILPILVAVIILGFLIFRARTRLWRSLKILFGKD